MSDQDNQPIQPAINDEEREYWNNLFKSAPKGLLSALSDDPTKASDRDRAYWSDVLQILQNRLLGVYFDHATTTSDLEALYKAGDPLALQCAIAAAIHRGEPAPAWAAQAYVQKFMSVASGSEVSWDKVFGNPHPPRVRPGAQKKWAKLGWPVYWDVMEFQHSGLSLEEAFLKVAKKHLISSSIARDYYYRVKNGYISLESE